MCRITVVTHSLTVFREHKKPNRNVSIPVISVTKMFQLCGLHRHFLDTRGLSRAKDTVGQMQRDCIREIKSPGVRREQVLVAPPLLSLVSSASV